MWSGSSRELSHTELSAAKTLSCTLETQLMLKTIKETGRWSPVPPADPALSRQFPTNLSFTNYETQEPSGYVPPLVQKPALTSFLQKPTPPPPVISFPPEFDPTPIVVEYSRSRSSTPAPSRACEVSSEISKEIMGGVCVNEVSKKSASELSFEKKYEQKPLAAEPACERKYVTTVSSLVRDAPDSPFLAQTPEAHKNAFDTSFLSKAEKDPPGTLPISLSAHSEDESVGGYQPQSVSLPPDIPPYYPESMREKPEPKVFRPEPPSSGSPLVFALTTAPNRAFSPLPTVTKPPTPPAEDALPDFQTELPVIPGVRPVSMLAALTVASERPYSPIPRYPPFHSVSAKAKEEETKDEKKQSYISTLEKNIWSPKGVDVIVTSDESDSYGLDKYVSQKPELKGKQCVKIPRLNSPSRLSYSNSGLHKPSTIPPYQQTLGDGATPRSRSPQPTRTPTEKVETSSTQKQPSAEPKVSKIADGPKSEVKPLKSCVKSSERASSKSQVTSEENSSSTCQKTGQVCCKKVTISETSSCQRTATEPSVCKRSVREGTVCFKSSKETKQPTSSTCPDTNSKENSSQSCELSSSSALVEKTDKTKVERQNLQSETKQVCALGSSKTCTKKVSIIESHSSQMSSSTSVSLSSQIEGTSLSADLTSSSSCLRAAKADLCTLTKSATCSKPYSQATSVSSTAVASAASTCSVSSCSLSKSTHTSSTELSQSKPSPISSTKLSHATSHRISPLAVADIPTDSNETTFCKTSSGSQMFKPPVGSKSTETKSAPSTKTEKQSHHITTDSLPSTPEKCPLSKQEQKGSTCQYTKKFNPTVPSINIEPSCPYQAQSQVKSIPLTESVSTTPCPIITATPPSTPTTVSQSPNSAFSLPRKTSGSVASSLSRTLSAKIAANNNSLNNNSSSLPASIPNTGASTPNSGAGATKGGTAAGLTAPRRGRGVLNPQNLTPGARVPLCGQCHEHIRGPFITALGKIWCPDHFICVNKDCRRPLQDIGFVEESSGLYCEYCFEKYLAPTCHKCSSKIKGDCLNAIGKHFHPECFKCAFCSKLFGNNPFFLEEGLPYCENDWNELFTTKCFACGFPIEAGDRWVEALNNNYHSPCFNCTACKKNLEGESFFAKGGRPFCKSHAR